MNETHDDDSSEWLLFLSACSVARSRGRTVDARVALRRFVPDFVKWQCLIKFRSCRTPCPGIPLLPMLLCLCIKPKIRRGCVASPTKNTDRTITQDAMAARDQAISLDTCTQSGFERMCLLHPGMSLVRGSKMSAVSLSEPMAHLQRKSNNR